MGEGEARTTVADDLEAVRRAAELLLGARRVLFSTGAGMSADSGVPTYRDANGRWRDFEAFTRKGLRPAEIAHLDGFQRDPGLAWGFREHIRRLMAAAEPHAGYAVLTRWMHTLCPDSFLLTTNIDGLHRRAGVPRDRMWENYGNTWELQCLANCRPIWWEAPQSPLCELDPDTMRASNLPRCPFCGEVARPRIQMDFDEGFLQCAVGAARRDAFLAAGPVDVYVIIGTTLWFSWPDEVEQRPRVIHINPSPMTHAHYDDPIAITMGAEDALVGIDWMVRRMQAR